MTILLTFAFYLPLLMMFHQLYIYYTNGKEKGVLKFWEDNAGCETGREESEIVKDQHHPEQMGMA